MKKDIERFLTNAAAYIAADAAEAEFNRAKAVIETVDPSGWAAVQGWENAVQTVVEGDQAQDNYFEEGSARFWEFSLGSLFSVVIEDGYEAERAALEAAGFKF